VPECHRSSSGWRAWHRVGWDLERRQLRWRCQPWLRKKMKRVSEENSERKRSRRNVRERTFLCWWHRGCREWSGGRSCKSKCNAQTL